MGRRRRVGTLLGLVILVPTLGMCVLAWTAAAERWDERAVSARIRDDAMILEDLMESRAALNDEWIQSAAIASAADLGLDATGLSNVLGVDLSEHLLAARSKVDLRRLEQVHPHLAPRIVAVEAARASLDGRQEGALDAVSKDFKTLSDELDRLWRARLTDVREVAESSRSINESSVLQRRLEVLDRTFLALDAVMEQGDFANQILTGHLTPENTAGLLVAGGRYQAATAALASALGPHASEAWTSWQADPGTAHVERVIAETERDALDGGPIADVAPETYTLLLTDGVQWITGLTDVVTAAAADLAELANTLHAGASRTLAVQSTIAAVLALCSLGAGVALTRAVAHPLRELATFAHEVGAGNFHQQPPTLSGPREVAQTTRAIVDMAATVAAVEDYAIELARNPSSPMLDGPLPGQTGKALQTTVNHLRESMQAAEVRRRQLEEIASHDSLTGLLNRAAALESIERDLARARRDDSVFAVIFIDLDGLKAINDTYGHEIGDQAIRRTADALRASTRRSDIVARLGGDEFLVAITAPDGDREAANAAARILERVAAQSVAAGDEVVALRCSIGVAVAEPLDSSEDVIHKADGALYRAKQHGRARVCWYAPAALN